MNLCQHSELLYSLTDVDTKWPFKRDSALADMDRALPDGWRNPSRGGWQTIRGRGWCYHGNNDPSVAEPSYTHNSATHIIRSNSKTATAQFSQKNTCFHDVCIINFSVCLSRIIQQIEPAKV